VLFHSFDFLVFFGVFLLGFVVLRGRARLLFTLLASFLFYSRWYPPYAFLLVFLTFYAYFAALAKPSRASFAWIVLGAFFPLIFFKYTHFFIENSEQLFHVKIPIQARFPLPLGISFITFTVVAYLADVRRGKVAAERDFGKFALYVSFFPHLIAGPIMRPKELLPQFKHLGLRKKFVKVGLLLFAIGMLKKVVFADGMAPIVNKIYFESAQADLPHVLLALYAFAIQIYCDFSGYTDMATGIAFLLGIWLPLNFNRPYLASSIRDFWHRWHITLSRWLRDYLYIPLGGSRHGYVRTVLVLMVTMLLGGLWHGAAWTFVFWGFLHGLVLAIEYSIKKFFKLASKIPLWLKRLYAFHLVAFTWIFFRARDWTEALNILRGFRIPGDWLATLTSYSFPIGLIIVYFLVQRWDRISLSVSLVRRLPGPFVYALVFIVIISSIVLSAGNPSAFIYFDF